MRQKVYLSGGMKQKDWQKVVINQCKDFEFYNPRSHNLSTPEEYTAWDLHFVKQCDIVFAYMDAENTSGIGLSLEIGYATALNKTIILVDGKSDSSEIFKKQFRIIVSSANVVFKVLEEGIQYLNKFSINGT